MRATTPRQPQPKQLTRGNVVRTGRMILGGPAGGTSHGSADTQGPLASARSRASEDHGTLGQVAEQPSHQAKGDDDDADADFRAMRRRAKEGGLKAAGDAVVQPKASNVVAPVVGGGDGLNVHPCYFEYGAMRKNMQAAQDTDGQHSQNQNVAESLSGSEAMMVQFLKSYGLTGPLQAYVKAFGLQGLADPAGLVTADDEKLKKVFEGAQMEAYDELVLREAIQSLR